MEYSLVLFLAHSVYLSLAQSSPYLLGKAFGFLVSDKWLKREELMKSSIEPNKLPPKPRMQEQMMVVMLKSSS